MDIHIVKIELKNMYILFRNLYVFIYRLILKDICIPV